jgi:hypothetical protein
MAAIGMLSDAVTALPPGMRVGSGDKTGTTIRMGVKLCVPETRARILPSQKGVTIIADPAPIAR